MRDIKKFLKKLDLFGVNLNFKYQANDTYTTSLGGLFIIIFCGVCLGFGGYYAIPFIQRKNLSIIYYTMNIPKTEQIRLTDSKAAFSLGYQCDKPKNFSVTDIFDLEFKFVIYSKNSSGSTNKKKEKLGWHYCKYEDFYNRYNDSIDFLGLKKFHCLDSYERTIEGIFSDQIFTYYEFAVTNKYKNQENFETIYKYLSKNDCKLVFYYTDITIDLSNYKEPIKPFLNSIFIQLNPTLDIKRNVYFMNQYLYDDDFIIGVFQGDEKPKQIETLFSRYEEYALYVGPNFDPNNTEYAKIFIRADTKKTSIKRTYQKVTEFYADASSLLIALYEVLIIVFTYINNFYAELSVTKRLFFFKELGLKHIINPKKTQQIIKITKYSNEVDLNSMETIQNNANVNMTCINYKKSTPNNMGKNKIFFSESNSDNSSYKNECKESTSSIKKEAYNKKKNKYFTSDSEKSEKIYVKNKYVNSMSKLNNDRKKSKKRSTLIDLNNLKSSNLKDNQQQIDYSFNVCEIFAITFCCKCLGKNLKLRDDLNKKANELLYYKLDIHNYLRNMFLFDIINQTIIDDKKKNIINLLSRPIVSVTNNEKYEEEIFYKEYEEKDFDKFYEGITELSQKTQKEGKEEKLIKLTNKYLNGFL